jgi:hypothetical protein
MDKKPSFLWALVIGLLFTILQVVIYFLRFNSLNPEATPSDYLFFFIGGTLIGLGLIYFLRRSENKATYRASLIGFVIGIPFALFGMLLGGLAGPLGSILLGMSPGIFMTVIGYFLGRTFSTQ